MLFLEREDPSSPITLFVSSPGGQVGPGLAIYDVLRSVSCPFRTVCCDLLFLEREDPSSPITLFVSSPGGQVGPGLAIYDVLRSVSCPFRTVCCDLAASMGSIIFMAGDEREMYPHASFMIHDPLIPQGAGGSALALQETSTRLMERRRTLNTILAERSGLTLKRIQSLTCKDTYLEAERSLDLGFATRIIESRKEL